ncbi:MAG: M28 family peptidase [Candidatus Marinimicrobia bacterium]|jgi:Zn-dependent M28 family amino/carboxypeptidase|nr:M28 family peptidase [Candidatus Neomarinimicrobiota bacterium]MBT6943495.1 M28 family peptidase [Candidatus Neomarinimicrobiota bacterium]MBT7920965.1 M28 family peptidase [Candidatus Neomarinimicrobiota bacterium]MCP4932505.1 M28 family peptidase [Candidatus Neomarinimicrobiota bacterium]MDP6201123.1 M28 family peptidase [Candidatus Neomarinimicrobiota bacterium]|tara:strand:- start:1825 stop:2739 length:915 start_codon:yes stop_codon:yes gene_type:complete
MKRHIHLIIFLFASAGGCQTKIPNFNGDAAFAHLVAQCDFGPRNPGSVGHQKALEYYLNILSPLADSVMTQPFIETMPRTKEKVEMHNVIAQFNPDAKKQIMLSAHWDTRPWGDRSLSVMRKNQPILGANDGASGVAVLLSLAKILHDNPQDIGVNLVLFDAEDYGTSGDSWSYCKGSQYFSKHLPIPLPEYAINLDMIGDANLEIYIERISYKQNPSLVLDLWGLAGELKLNGFKKMAYHSIFDDHVPLYELAGIPAVDIIDFDYPDEKTNYHHTYNDIVENCSPESLWQVGTLMVHHIYNQQ